MPLVRIKQKYQVTIPASLRRKLGLEVGDYVEAELEDNKIVLKPKSVIDKEKQEAWERLREVLDRVHEKIGEVSEEEVERDVLKAIREIREQEYGKGRAAAVGCYLPFHHPPDVL